MGKQGYPLPRAKGGKGEDTSQKNLQRFPKLLKSNRTQIQNPRHISGRATKENLLKIHKFLENINKDKILRPAQGHRRVTNRDEDFRFPTSHKANRKQWNDSRKEKNIVNMEACAQQNVFQNEVAEDIRRQPKLRVQLTSTTRNTKGHAPDRRKYRQKLRSKNKNKNFWSQII